MHSERSPRTVLEAIIRERRQTLEEFSADAERYAIEHGMSATLSPRHVQRLAAGRRADGRPLGPVRPVTRKLLEEMLGRSIGDLLSRPDDIPAAGSMVGESELRARLAASRSIDRTVVAAFQEQINQARIIDRRLGAPALLAELREQITQIERALRFAVSAEVRISLAAVLVDACALAGWLSLDVGALMDSWRYYDQARGAAVESGSPALQAYACAGQSVVLLDLGEAATAVELTEYARDIAHRTAPQLLNSWLAAAHGEACAATGLGGQSFHAFDDASRLMTGTPDVPFLVFNDIHLARWYGNALARLGEREAIDILSRTLAELDPTFTRAEAALRTDLAEVLVLAGERDHAMTHTAKASRLARQIGSVRQQTRIARLQTSAR